MLAGMSLRWLTVFLDFPADAFDAGVTFWQQATGSGLSPFRGTASEFATLRPASGDAYLRVQRVRTGAGGCHLDLHVDTAIRPLAETAAAARALGARVQHMEDGLIVADSPGGFTFCLVEWHGESVIPPALVTDGEASRVDTLCLDVPPANFARECSFWAALTGGETRPARVPGFAYLTGPLEMPVRLLLQQLDTAAPEQRVSAHIDIGATDRRRAVARHVALGARIVETFPFWTVLADPAGRRYCLVDRDPG
jgi:hypothetical protein